MRTLRETLDESIRLDELNRVSRSNKSGMMTFGKLDVGDTLYMYAPYEGISLSKVKIEKVRESHMHEVWATEMGGEQVKQPLPAIELSWDGGYSLAFPANASYVEYGDFKSSYILNNLICATSEDLLEEGKKFHGIA